MNNLENVYEQMLKEEFETVNEETVGTTKPGELDGAEKAKLKKSLDADAKKPTEHTTKTDVTLDDGEPKPLAKKTQKFTEREDGSEAKPRLSFNDIYSKIIKEEDGIVTAQDVEGKGFNDDAGDFESDPDLASGDDDETEEEVDVASELRLMAERMNELADRIGSPDDDLDDLDMDETGDVGPEDGVEGQGIEDEASGTTPVPESVDLKNKGSNKIGKTGTSGAGTAKVNKAVDRNGKITPLKKKCTCTSGKVKGNGPTVKGRGEAFLK